VKEYLYSLLFKYLSFYIRPNNTVCEINPSNDRLIQKFAKGKTAHITDGECDIKPFSEDYIILNSNLHYERDIQLFLNTVHKECRQDSKIIVIYYSSLWKPLMQFASLLKLRSPTQELNWLAHEDIENLLDLASFEIVHKDRKVLIPVWVPFLSYLVNRFITPLPFFRSLSLVNIVVARPVGKVQNKFSSASIIVPARNEAGNIENAIKRLPKISENDEIIFVEGNSTDNTWDKIQEAVAKYNNGRKVIGIKQDGTGKGDAVRKGFSIAKGDILMILDADLSVAPEDLPKFYDAMIKGKGEFINGSRLVYPREKKSMRFLNMIANKIFATGFSFLVGQCLKDTLCGTKVLSRKDYLKLVESRAYFGDFDPFGDFDLIFGSVRLGLKIVEIPVHYHERTYGSTNIQRWRHGFLLFKMLLFAALKIKFT